jgi:hypothetical protein
MSSAETSGRQGISPVCWQPGAGLGLSQPDKRLHRRFQQPACSNQDEDIQGVEDGKEIRHSILTTNDLAQHLLYDDRARTIKIFHYISWLKAHLRYIETTNKLAGFDDAAKL